VLNLGTLGWSLWKLSFRVRYESFVRKKPKTFIGSQTPVQGLPFSQKIPKMNICTFEIHRRILWNPSLAL